MSDAPYTADADPDQTLEVVIKDDVWLEYEGLVTLCTRSVRAGLDRVENPRGGKPIVLFSNDAAVRELNRRFRNKNKPTNVLAFPAPEPEGYPGDVIVAFETCAREAEAAGVPLPHHAAHLVLHGVLHLNGFDHQTEDEASEMEALETAALAESGIANPHLAREQA